MALTATMPLKVEKHVMSVLQLRDPTVVRGQSFLRKNLRYNFCFYFCRIQSSQLVGCEIYFSSELDCFLVICSYITFQLHGGLWRGHGR